MKIFDWRGISAGVENNWEIVALGGNDKDGFVSLGDNLKTYCEIKWKFSKAKVNISRVLKEFLSSIEKKAKQKGEKFGSLTAINLLENERGISYKWNTEKITAYGEIYRCEKCGRVMLTQVLVNSASLAKKVLSTVKCHGESSKDHWNLYGFSFSTPNNFKLETYSFKSGYLKMSFARDAEKLAVERWGLANNLMLGNPIEKWFDAYYGSSTKNGTTETEKIRINDHDGLLVKTAFKTGLFKIKRSELVHMAWHCGQSNRIVVLFSSGQVKEKSKESLLGEIAESIKCH